MNKIFQKVRNIITKNKIIYAFIVSIFIFGVILSLKGTYALFNKTISSNKVIAIKTGTRYIGIYGENKENIELGQTYTFTIENRGSENASYRLYIEGIENSSISYSYTKSGITTTGTLANKTIDEANLKVGEKITITIKFTGSGSYKGKLKVETKDYYNNEPNAPELVGDMIPVVWNGSSWAKADKENTNNSWYNYDKQIWANAVTIKDTAKRTEYKNATVGTVININDVNLMLVWIPRYSYTLRQSYGYQIEGGSTPSQATPGAFDIKFIRTSTIESGSGKYTGTTPTGYFTPSSFCWGNTCDVESTRGNSGNIELSGIWISKFELTGAISAITSLPNQKSLTNQTNQAFFTAIQTQMNNTSGSTNYGFNGNNYDTHMIKNTEWGAMAYLSQSKYGKYGNSNYIEANKEIYINNYSGYQTGCSGGSPSVSQSNICQHQYYEETSGTGASTTGTIYGIYDTSGGALEKVMGNVNNIIASSGFSASTMPDAKYYNKYTNTTTSIKGDAIYADGTAGFYGDFQYFVNSSNPWFYRGSPVIHAVGAGIFEFESYTGITYPTHGSRIALVAW